MILKINSVSPDEAVEQEHRAADDSGGARLLVLRSRERQSVIHVTLVMHDGLKHTHQCVSLITAAVESVSLQ